MAHSLEWIVREVVAYRLGRLRHILQENVSHVHLISYIFPIVFFILLGSTYHFHLYVRPFLSNASAFVKMVVEM